MGQACDFAILSPGAFQYPAKLGLRNPDVDHPLLNTPLGKLPETKCSLNASLAPILERIKKDYPAMTAGPV
jgi:hypothetical protein